MEADDGAGAVGGVGSVEGGGGVAGQSLGSLT